MSFFNHVWGKKIAPAPYAPPAFKPAPAPAAPWSIGPVIEGKNWSVGMEGALVSTRDSWFFDFPVAQKGLDRWSTPGPHYVTRPWTGLAGITLRLDFEVEGDGNLFGVMGNQTSFVPYICLHFQRSGDDWSAKPPYDGFRWYSNTQTKLVPGRQSVEVPLTADNWHPVENGPGPAEFADALANASCVGVTFGNEEGNGHGVAAATPGNRFICHSFALV